MRVADVAPSPGVSTGWLVASICAGLACLFAVSTVALVVVLVRRSRRG